MKLAFLHPENEFTSALLQQLQARLPGHELTSWIIGEPAPVKDCEALIALGKVGPDELEGLDQLGFIQTASTGYESVDLDAASERGIWVSFAPSGITGNAASVAEFAVLLLLAASRRLGTFLQAQKNRDLHPPLILPALRGKTLCIVGLGEVGAELASRIKPFGMKVLATDEHPEDAPESVTASKPEALRELLSQSDYVAICVRASKENENLIDASMLAAMKPGAIVVNVARGTLLDEAALLAAVQDGQIAAAGLDVVRDEPLQPNNPLLAHPQLVVTPHVAGFTDLMLDGTSQYVAAVVEDVAAGRKPASVLNQPEKPRRPLQG